LARTAQQCAIGGVLYQRVLEQKSGVREQAALEDKPASTSRWSASCS
jgi:hypothetical protein